MSGFAIALELITRYLSRRHDIPRATKDAILAFIEKHQKPFSRLFGQEGMNLAWPVGENAESETIQLAGELFALITAYFDDPVLLLVAYDDTSEWKKESEYQSRKMEHDVSDVPELVREDTSDADTPKLEADRERERQHRLNRLQGKGIPDGPGKRPTRKQLKVWRALASMVTADRVLEFEGTLLWPNGQFNISAVRRFLEDRNIKVDPHTIRNALCALERLDPGLGEQGGNNGK